MCGYWILKLQIFFFLFLFSNDDIQNCVIYLCATMWHETYDEMLKILTSMFRFEILLLLKVDCLPCETKHKVLN